MSKRKIFFPGLRIGRTFEYVKELAVHVTSIIANKNGDLRTFRKHLVRCILCGFEIEKLQGKFSDLSKHRCDHCMELPKGQTGLNALFARYTESVVKRKGKMLFTIEEFKEMTSHNCTYCGSPPSKISQTTEWGSYPYNGIDRIDNSQVDYDPKNCVPCCYTCNIAKSDRTEQEFREHIARLIKFQMPFYEQRQIAKQQVK